MQNNSHRKLTGKLKESTPVQPKLKERSAWNQVGREKTGTGGWDLCPRKGVWEEKGDYMGGDPPWEVSILSYPAGCPSPEIQYGKTGPLAGWRPMGTNGKTIGRVHLGGAPEHLLAPETGQRGQIKTAQMADSFLRTPQPNLSEGPSLPFFTLQLHI